MTSTTMDLMWSSIPRQVAANASLVDKQHFKALWEVTLFLSGEGIIGYFIPRNMATQMGAEELKGIANKLSGLVKTSIYIVWDFGKLAYYIGQIFEPEYVNNLTESTLMYKVDFEGPNNEALQKLEKQKLERQKLEKQKLEKQELLSRRMKQFYNDIASFMPPNFTIPKIEKKIPKPRNIWIMYRQDKHKSVAANNPGMHTSEISKVVSDLWRSESPSVIAHYQKLAEEEKSAHNARYPYYRCSPRKPSEIKKRKRASEESSLDTGHPASANSSFEPIEPPEAPLFEGDLPDTLVLQSGVYGANGWQ